MTPPAAPLVVVDVPKLPPRAADAHKGTFGRVLVVAGSVGLSGAAALAGTAALRGGAGLVQVATPAPVAGLVAAAQPCLMTAWLAADRGGRLAQAALPELLALADAATAVVVGPGLGQSVALKSMVPALLHHVRRPLVLDADGLNALGRQLEPLTARGAPTILTPHPGEFGRLTGRDTKEVQADRQGVALEFARRHGVVLVLKGAGTVVTDGGRLYTNTTGNPGMATGGTGDVLAGLLGALLAQGVPPFDAAVMGAYLHGRAGDLARDRLGEVSLIATDLLEHLPAAFAT
ncbi:MAG: NAD(P)H-hydrate dehydratase [Gemmataceae bacterium]